MVSCVHGSCAFCSMGVRPRSCVLVVDGAPLAGLLVDDKHPGCAALLQAGCRGCRCRRGHPACRWCRSATGVTRVVAGIGAGAPDQWS